MTDRLFNKLKREKMPKYIETLAQQTGQGAIGQVMGLALSGINNRIQRHQQKKMNEIQMSANKQMIDYEQMKQLEMWEKTGYGGQMRQIKDAGLNPGLLYGMGGAGGQTIGSQSGGIGGGHADSDAGNASGMGISMMNMQLQLMDAQKKNIEADTEAKKAQAMDTTASAEGKGLANALTAWLQSTTPEGEQLEGGEKGGLDKSIRGQQELTDIQKKRADTQFRLDENEREKLKNNAVLNEIGENIALLAKKGLSETEIYKNLQKTGKLLDAEIAWNEMDISGNAGKFIFNLIKMLVKPR